MRFARISLPTVLKWKRCQAQDMLGQILKKFGDRGAYDDGQQQQRLGP